jgi:hypothetical protein
MKKILITLAAIIMVFGISHVVSAQMGPGAGSGGTMHDKGMGPGGMCPCACGMDGREMGRRKHMDWNEKNDPARREKIKQIHQLGQDYRDTDDPAKKKEIENQLRPLVDEELKVEQQDAKKHLDRMQKRIDERRKVLKERDDHWKEVVDHQVKRITGQDEYLDSPMRVW